MAKWYEGAEESAEIERSVNRHPNGKPRRDIVAVDGQKIALADGGGDARPHRNGFDVLSGEG
jgi:hypothetical protein